ncbi:MAG: 1-acyl-sn-glycerol-3-phosphate acyltransferase [Bacteroidota bacterium]
MKILRWFALQVFHILGWKFVGDIPQGISKAVLVVAPHTSNWDGFYGLLFCFVKQLPIKFAIKKEAMFFPLGLLLKRMGGIAIDRKKKSEAAKSVSMVHLMASMLQQQAPLILIIAPEGTRKHVKRWRRGFYHIAMQAHVPLILGYMDYKKKHIGFGPTVYPTGNLAKDIQQIQAFYKDKMGKYPAQGIR